MRVIDSTLEEPFQLLQIDPINWRSRQGIGDREKGNVFSFFFILVMLKYECNFQKI